MLGDAALHTDVCMKGVIQLKTLYSTPLWAGSLTVRLRVSTEGNGGQGHAQIPHDGDEGSMPAGRDPPV